MSRKAKAKALHRAKAGNGRQSTDPAFLMALPSTSTTTSRQSGLLPNGVNPITGRLGNFKVKGFEADPAAVERYAAEMARLNVQQNLPAIQAQVAELVGGLQSQVEEIRSQGPVLPDPPRRHQLRQKMHRPNTKDPRKSWLEISCENCTFMLYSQVSELQEMLAVSSYLCDLPMATAEECNSYVINWQALVAEVHNNTFHDRHLPIDVQHQPIPGLIESIIASGGYDSPAT